MPVQAQTTSEFGYQLHPEKLLENTEGILQIFVISNEMMVPKQVTNVKVVSSDNSIIQILGIEDGNDKYTKNVLIKAKKAGIVNIALAAPGFSSKEITLEVFNNNNHPTQILMKITPNTFPIDGPRYGHIGLELTTIGGIPTVTSENRTIYLDTPNKDVIKLKNSEVIITSGEYYVITEFEIIGSGNAIIFAETEGMKKISSLVNVLEAKKPLTLKLYTYPENFNSYSGTKGIALVQLVDTEGIPVVADEDINFELSVENPDVSINTSHDFEEINFSKKKLTIEKGSYTTFTDFSPRLNLGDSTEDLEQSLNIFISVENYLSDGRSVKISHDQIGSLEGKGPAVTKAVPFLTTGKQEIIAVTYYETEAEVTRQIGSVKNLDGTFTTTRQLVTVTVPVLSKEDHSISFSSSESDIVNPINPIMKAGESVVMVFGETGTVISERSVVFSITDNQGVKTVTANPIGPSEDDISLVVEPLVPMILAEKEFPVVAYLTDGDEITVTEEIKEVSEEEDDPRIGVTPFIDDAVLTFSANEFIETEYVTIKQDQSYALTNMMSNEVGQTELSYQMGGIGGTMSIASQSTDPTQIFVSFPENILANSNTTATIQLLDSASNPVYTKKDIKIELVSNDEQVIKIPQGIVIEAGEYFTLLELEAINEGKMELALLSEDFGLIKYNINVIDISPVLSLGLIGGNWNERIEGKLSVTIPEIETSLDGFNVEWTVEGGEVVQFDEVTNSNGIAIMNVIANDKETITISANVSGNGLSSSTLFETVDILNKPVEEVAMIEEQETGLGLPIDINSMILIIIPVAVVVALFMLKRMDKLDMITEKIPIADKLNIGDRVEEIKERISDIRNR